MEPIINWSAIKLGDLSVADEEKRLLRLMAFAKFLTIGIEEWREERRRDRD